MRDPERYGVVEFGADGRAISLEEKPKNPKSHFAVPGFMFTTNRWSNFAERCNPRPRGELEITDLNRVYLQRNQLFVRLLGRGMAWLDTGTQTSLLEAGNYIATIEHRQGLKVACLEEIALRMGFIDHAQLEKIIDKLPKAEYREYLRIRLRRGRRRSFLEPQLFLKTLAGGVMEIIKRAHPVLLLTLQNATSLREAFSFLTRLHDH